jgi:hypothetical protein
MAEQVFEKILTANDTGLSQSHQAGIHVPKRQQDLIAFLPPLNAGTLNPSVWLTAVDKENMTWRLRYIYYNNRLHKPGGTRDEFRLTRLTAYFRATGAVPGDRMTIAGEPRTGKIRIDVISTATDPKLPEARTVRLRGWRRVH